MENTLVFEEGKYGPKIETLSDYDSSIFKDIYDKGFKCLNEILINEKQYDNNNIIAFIGERGGGKTSCMMSFEKILLEGLKEKSEIFKKISINEINSPNSSEQEKKELKEFIYNTNLPEDISIDNIKNSKFYREFLLKQIEKANVFKKKYSFFNYSYTTLDTIDPSFFTEKSNILEIIIAILFKNFKEKDKSNEDISLQKTISRCFKNVYKNISIINNKYNFDGENYDKLQDLSASITLKKEIRELITKYLEFMNKNSEQNKLIIKIDDIDLNIKYSYEMVEQIRKYLIQDNIIILMAVKLDQLEKIIRVNYIKSFDSKIENIDLNYGQMSYRYLEKLIPQNRRLHLINLEKKLKTIQIDILGKNKDLENNVRQLIFDKLKILFLNDTVSNNPIVPKNLRFLINFINIFVKLEDIDGDIKGDEKRELFKKNIIDFDNYFFNGWLGNNLTIENAKIIEELHSKPVGAKNKYIVTKIVETLNKIIQDENNDNKLKRINEGKFISTNVSLGDVLENINNLEKVVVDTEHENFIVAIKSLYSRYIYDYYLDYREKERDNEESLEYSNFEIFLGGEVILSKNLLYNSEMFEKINLTKFHNELKYLFENKLNIIQLIKNINGSSSKNSFIEKLKEDLKSEKNIQSATKNIESKIIELSLENCITLIKKEITNLIDKDKDNFKDITLDQIVEKIKNVYSKNISYEEIKLLINRNISDKYIRQLIKTIFKKLSKQEIELLINDKSEYKSWKEFVKDEKYMLNSIFIQSTINKLKRFWIETNTLNKDINKLIRDKLTEKKMSFEEIELIDINELIHDYFKILTDENISSEEIESMSSDINKLIRDKLIDKTDNPISSEEIELIIEKINEVIHDHLNKLTCETPLFGIKKRIEFIVFLTYFFKDIHPESKRLNSSEDFKNLGRLRDETFYNGKLNFNNKIDTSYNVEFDIFSPFFFGLSEYRVLSRYSYIDGVSDLYNFVKDINEEIENEEDKININPFKNIHLRNIELIEKGFESLVPPNSTERFEIIESLYKQLGKFKLSTDIVTINYEDQYKKLLEYINEETTRKYFNKLVDESND